MKNILRAVWTGIHLDAGKLACALLQYRKGLAKYVRISSTKALWTACSGHHRSFAPEWQHSAKEADEQERSHSEQVEHYYNQHVCALPDICKYV